MMIGKNKKGMAVVSLLTVIAVGYFVKGSPAQNVHDEVGGSRIQGRVMSAYGPVENARVRVPGKDKFVLTDRQGRFDLQTGHPPGTRLRVTAGKEGSFNNGQVTNRTRLGGELYLNPVYLNDHPGYRFISPQTCAGCHVKVTRYWDKSKMAHTTSNPKLLDMYYGTDAAKRRNIGPGYKLDNPRSNGNCISCHAPSAAASRPWSQDPATVLRSPLTEWDGISCDYCHKVRKVVPDKSKPSGMAPILERQSAPGSPSILVFGPYDDVVVPPMAASYNPVYEEGRFCSTCHSHFKELEVGKSWDRSKVYSDSEWKGFGLEKDHFIPIQTTYQEWKQWQEQLAPDDSNKGKKCQDCHMSWRKEMLPYDNYVVDGGARNMWGTYRSPQNIRPHHFDGGTEIQLKTALSMEIKGEKKDKTLIIKAYITNTNGGHWVPTGETMRSVMLVLNVVDSNGTPLKMTKGSTLPEWTGEGKAEQGNYAGMPGAVFARVLQDDNGDIHVPFWRATRIASDTRIRPKTTRVMEFQFAVEDPDDEPSAEAKLVYRPVIKPLAVKKNWDVEDIIIAGSAW
ncbi:MAG: multiheme c-type cytochrome [Pseudomonadota bacterium]